MIDVYLVQSIYKDGILPPAEFDYLVLHIKETDIWIDDRELTNWTPKFWEAVKNQKTDLMTYIGEL
jgi:hypothetical protein